MRQLTARQKPNRALLPATQKWRQNKRRWPGLFVSFEGGEGAGKSSLIASLYDFLTGEGLEVIATREPGGTPLGEQIRECLLNPNDGITLTARAELCLFLAARAQHIDEVITPALEAGKVVLCDRFNDSTIAYQGVGRGLGLDYVKQLCTLICEGVTPDLTFYLDVAPEVGLHRVSKGGRGSALDRIESETLAFHERIRKGFYQIAAKEKERVHIIDAHQNREEVLEQVLEVVKQRLPKPIQ